MRSLSVTNLGALLIGRDSTQCVHRRLAGCSVVGVISGSFAEHPVEVPAVGDALQFMLASVFEDEA